MSYKPRERDLFPEWIYDVSIGDDDFLDLLIEALVARSHAIRAIRERGSYAPKLCRTEFEQAEEVLAAVREGRVAPGRRFRRTAVALRKFVNAHQCARYLESDSSKIHARDLKRQRTSTARGRR